MHLPKRTFDALLVAVGWKTFSGCTGLRTLKLGAAEDIAFIDTPETVFEKVDTSLCDLYLNRDGSAIGEVTGGNVWKGYTWKSVTGFAPGE